MSAHMDERGFFLEIFRQNDLKKETGVDFSPVQWNHSMSLPGVIRGVHMEDWNKLVYPVTGILYAPIVDLRPQSSTFGKVEYITIDNSKGENKKALFLPKGGIGNSICVLGEEPLNYIYLVDEYWDNSKAKGVAWDDPDLAIKWPVDSPTVSDRDRANPKLRELFPEKFK